MRNGATATPIRKKRAFKSTAAAIAANTPPPAPRTAATANWAEAEKVMTENTHGARTPQPRERARTPKEIATAPVTNANGSPARAPARYPPLLRPASFLILASIVVNGLSPFRASTLCDASDNRKRASQP